MANRFARFAETAQPAPAANRFARFAQDAAQEPQSTNRRGNRSAETSEQAFARRQEEERKRRQAEEQRKIDENPNRIANSVARGVGTLGESVVQAAGVASDAATGFDNWIARGMGQAPVERESEALKANALAQAMREQKDLMFPAPRATAQLDRELKSADGFLENVATYARNPVGTLQKGVETLIGSAPAVRAMGAVTGGATLAGGGAGVDAAAQFDSDFERVIKGTPEFIALAEKIGFDRARNELKARRINAVAGAAGLAGGLMAGATRALGLNPADDMIAGKAAQSGAIGTVVREGLGEVPEEVATQIATNLGARATGSDVAWNDQAGSAAAGGLVLGSAAAGPVAAATIPSTVRNIRETIRQANSAADISSPMAAAFTRAAQQTTARILTPNASPDAVAGAQVADDAFRAAGVGTVASADMAEQDALSRDLDAATRDQLGSEAEIDRLLIGTIGAGDGSLGDGPKGPARNDNNQGPEVGAVPLGGMPGTRPNVSSNEFAGTDGAIGAVGVDAERGSGVAAPNITTLPDGSIFLPGNPAEIRQRLADASERGVQAVHAAKDRDSYVSAVHSFGKSAASGTTVTDADTGIVYVIKKSRNEKTGAEHITFEVADGKGQNDFTFTTKADGTVAVTGEVSFPRAGSASVTPPQGMAREMDGVQGVRFGRNAWPEVQGVVGGNDQSNSVSSIDSASQFGASGGRGLSDARSPVDLRSVAGAGDGAASQVQDAPRSSVARTQVGDGMGGVLQAGQPTQAAVAVDGPLPGNNRRSDGAIQPAESGNAGAGILGPIEGGARAQSGATPSADAGVAELASTSPALRDLTDDERNFWPALTAEIRESIDNPGGRMIVNNDGTVGRTKWADLGPVSGFWRGRPKGWNSDDVLTALDRASAGEKLTAKQKNIVEYAKSWARDYSAEHKSQLLVHEQDSRLAEREAIRDDIESSLPPVADTSPQQRASTQSLGGDYTAKLLQYKKDRRAWGLNPQQEQEYQDLLELDRETGKVGGRPMVGVRNKTAYVDALDAGELLPVQGFTDADDFKTLNDKLGHAAGDDAIREIGEVLVAEFGEGNVFHRSGDEFLFQGADQADVDAKMQRVRDRLSQITLRATDASGNVQEQRGIGLSYGTGTDEASADAALVADKQRRKESGQRVGQRRTSDRRGVGSESAGERIRAGEGRSDSAAEGVGDVRQDRANPPDAGSPREVAGKRGDTERASDDLGGSGPRAEAVRGGQTGGSEVSGGTARGSVDTIRAAISQALGPKFLARLDRQPWFQIVDTVADLPPDVRKSITGGGIAGFVLGNRVYVVAEGAAANPVGVTLHELGVHYGMTGILGEDFAPTLAKFKRLRAKDDRVGRAYERATEAADKDKNGELTEAAKATLDEEALAYFVEENWDSPDTRGIVYKVIDAIKRLLNRWGIRMSWLNASPELLREVAIGAARMAADGRVSVGKDGGLVYARDLLGEAPSETAQLVAQWKAKVDAKLRGDGRAYVKPSEGPGDLFGGPAEETSDLFAKPQQRAQGTLFSRKRDNSTAAEDRALDRGNLEEAIRIGKRRIAEQREALGDISNGVILKMDGRDSWAIVMPDVEGGGKWRMQMFDRRGFVGHRTRNSRDAALDEALQDKYTTRDDGALDELQDSPEFVRGNFIAGEMMQLNAGKITSAEFDKRIADYDSSIKVVAKYSRKADGGSVSPMDAAEQLDADYRMQHRPPSPSTYGDVLHNLNVNTFDDEIYTANAAQYFGTGDAKLDRKATALFRQVRGRPDAMVTVYRAAPKGLASAEIRPGDWVTPVKEYAAVHGDGPLNGDYQILEKTVKASELYTSSDSILEAGWHPPQSQQDTRQAPPREGLGASGLAAVERTWDAAGISAAISERNGVIKVGKIVVPQDQRGRGIGTDAMRQLTDYADATGQRIVLSPSADFGGDKGRLVEFYKRTGFVENNGRGRDLEISETMYREPKQAPRYSRAPTITVNGTERPTTDSTGKSIHPTEEGVRKFWEWFGSSAVTDDAGRPLVVYHGTVAGAFDEFIPRTRKGEQLGFGIHFAEDGEFASRYANPDQQGRGKTGGQVVPAFLAIEDPLLGDAIASEGSREFALAERLLGKKLFTTKDEAGRRSVWMQNVIDAVPQERAMREIQAAGFDGVRYASAIRGRGLLAGNVSGKSRSWIAFAPEQVKSATGNAGTFSPTDPRIAYSRKTPAEARAEAAQKQADLGAQLVVSPGQSFVYTDKFTDDWRGQTRKMRERIQDKLLSVRDAQKDIEKIRGAIEDAANVYRRENLMHGRVGDQRDKLQDTHVKPLIEAMAEAKVSPALLEDYLEARHAKERNEKIAATKGGMPDGASGMTTAQAEDFLQGRAAGHRSGVTLDPAMTRQVSRLARKVDAITSETRRRLLDSGQITQDTFDALENAYAAYVPLRGKDGTEGGKGRGTGKGIDVRGKPVLRAAGRGEGNRAQNILAEVIADAERSIINAEKLRVGRTLARLVLENPNPDVWAIEPVKTELKVSEGTPEEIYEAVKNLDQEEGTIIVKVKGKPYRIVIEDQRMADALKNMAVETVPEVIQYVAGLNRYFSAVLTRYNPSFVGVNMTRDLLFGMTGIWAEHGAAAAAKAAASYFPAMRAAWRDIQGKPPVNAMGRYAREFAEAGGKTYFGKLENVEDLSQRIGEEFKTFRQMAMPKFLGGEMSPVRALAKVARDSKMVQAIEAVNDTVENTLRLSVYAARREAGASIEQAAEYAKNISVNFNRRGSATSWLNALYLFFNAATQGAHRTLTLLKNPKVQGVLGGLAALQATSAMFLMGLDDDDGEPLWDSISPWDKQRNLILAIPIKRENGWGATVIKIPMPYGFNLFPYMGGRSVELARDLQEKPVGTAIADYTTDAVVGVAQAMSPIPFDDGWKAALPHWVRIFTVLAENKDDLGIPVRQGDQNDDYDKPRSASGRDDTPLPFKIAATALNRLGGGDDYTPPYAKFALDWAPEDLAYLFKTFAGGLGSNVVKSGTLTEKLIAGVPVNFKDVPVLSSFVSNVDQRQATSTRYYDHKDDIEREVARQRDIAKKTGEVGDNPMGIKIARNKSGVKIKRGKDSYELEGASGSLFDTYKESEKEISRIRDEMRAAFNDQSIGYTERIRKIDELKSEREEVQRELNAAWREQRKKRTQ